MSQSSNPAERAELPKQFLVSRERLSPIPGWRRVKLGDYYLHLSAGVGATRINESGNRAYRETIVIGWFGYREGFYDGTGLSELTVDGQVEDIYPEMTGRFVVLSRENGRLLCTSDAGAQFPVVYREETGELGSTPMVLGWTMELRKAPRLSEGFSRAGKTGGGSTPPFWMYPKCIKWRMASSSRSAEARVRSNATSPPGGTRVWCYRRACR